MFIVRKAQVLFATLALGLLCLADAPYLSPSKMVATKDGKTIYIVCATADRLLEFDTATEKVTKSFDVKELSGLALSADEKQLFLTAGVVEGVIHELDRGRGQIVRTLPAGHSPQSPVCSPDGQTLYYCNRFSRADQPDIHALDLRKGKISKSAKAIREPSTMLLSPDGKNLWVSNYLPLMPANNENVYASLSIFDANTLKLVDTLDLPSGAFALCGATMSKSGQYYFVTHSVGRFTVPTTHLDRGWINTSAVSIFDVEKREYINCVLLDDTVRGAPNPWGVAIVGDDQWLCVAISGTHELMVIDLPQMLELLQNAPNPEEVVNDLAFLYDVKERIELEGMGPRELVVHEDKVYSSMYFSDLLNVTEFWEDGPGAALDLPLVAEAQPPDDIRKGEIAFFDATLCYQNWLSCASCHPDVRMDGTNWDLMNDGIGNPKQSRSLLYTHKTSPVMITGIRASAEIAVSKGFELIQFHALPEERLATVNAYLKSLEPVPSPYLQPDGTLTKAALRGKKVFEGKAGCVNCHTPPYHSNKRKFAFGLGTDEERDREFATPILIEAWRTAPYMYDGRAVTIREVVTTDNHNNKHGNTKDLTAKEVNDLVEYIKSL